MTEPNKETGLFDPGVVRIARYSSASTRERGFYCSMKYPDIYFAVTAVETVELSEKHVSIDTFNSRVGTLDESRTKLIAPIPPPEKLGTSLTNEFLTQYQIGRDVLVRPVVEARLVKSGLPKGFKHIGGGIFVPKQALLGQPVP